MRAHQHAAGVNGNQNQEALSRSCGGFSTKIHLRTNAKGDPLTFDVTGGEVHEVKGFNALMELHDAQPDKLFGDKVYDSDCVRKLRCRDERRLWEAVAAIADLGHHQWLRLKSLNGKPTGNVMVWTSDNRGWRLICR